MSRPADSDIGERPPQGLDAAQSDARTDWELRIYRRLTDTAEADPASALPAPSGVRATAGAGHIRLDWDPVADAAGYVLERSTGEDGTAEVLRHGGSDVPAVPQSHFADTGLEDGIDYHYRVGSVAGGEYPVWAWSEPVHARTLGAAPGRVAVDVDLTSVTGRLDRVWHMIGSERLSQLRLGVDEHGHDVGSEFEESLRLAHADLGVTLVRAHAVFHDDNAVVHRGPDGALGFDFARVDEMYDRILRLGIRPVVELSYMPKVMAADPELTVFTYRAIISPPRDWAEWRALVAALAAHLVDRYGIDEVAQWPFEVWNEPNLIVFWSGTQADYLRLYDESARAVKGVDPRLKVGGPATAAAEWIRTLATHAREADVVVDFVTTHTYGNLPVDVRPALRAAGVEGAPIYWTEWGVGSTHFGFVHDGVIGAPFALSGYAAVQGRVDALAYWVVSDHFEELGRPPRLFHNGFGLLTVGNLRKPRYWGVHLAAHLGDTVLACRVDGDGADVLVQAWATRHDDGTVDVLVWNGTLNTSVMGGDPRLDRDVRLTLTGLPSGTYGVDRARVDQHHSNVVARCPADVEWPDEDLWADLRAHDELFEEHLPDVSVAGDAPCFDFHLPMPGIVRIRLTSGDRQPGTAKESAT